MSKTDKAISRTLKRLKMALSNEEYYEAQELLASATNRLIGLGDEPSLARACDVSLSNVCNFIEAGEDKIAAQSIALYLKACKAASIDMDAVIDTLQDTSLKFVDMDARLLFLKHALLYCKGHPRASTLHFHAANAYWTLGNAEKMLQQLAFSNDVEVGDEDEDVLTLCLKGIEKSEHKSKALCMQCLRFAAKDRLEFGQQLFDRAQAGSVCNDSDEYVTLTKYVLLTLTREAKPLLQELHSVYSEIIDEPIDVLWNIIDTTFYGQDKTGGGLSSLFGSLFGGSA
eukprot:m.19000 g.19000  ORF g.19000 m.19000 type:complete len:285 (-) comp8383_c0_seq1:80-934(-)